MWLSVSIFGVNVAAVPSPDDDDDDDDDNVVDDANNENDGWFAFFAHDIVEAAAVTALADVDVHVAVLHDLDSPKTARSASIKIKTIPCFCVSSSSDAACMRYNRTRSYRIVSISLSHEVEIQ